MQLITAIESDDHGYGVTEEAEAAVLNRFTATRAKEDEDYHWQNVIDRAQARANSAVSCRTEHDFDAEGHELQGNDVLWEIRCKVSMENILLFV